MDLLVRMLNIMNFVQMYLGKHSNKKIAFFCINVYRNAKEKLSLYFWVKKIKTDTAAGARFPLIISLKLCCYFGRKLGLNVVTEENALVPFRW